MNQEDVVRIKGFVAQLPGLSEYVFTDGASSGFEPDHIWLGGPSIEIDAGHQNHLYPQAKERLQAVLALAREVPLLLSYIDTVAPTILELVTALQDMARASEEGEE